MKEPAAMAKATKKELSSTHSSNSIRRAQHEHERQHGALRRVITTETIAILNERKQLGSLSNHV